ncbi:MAG: ABC transporter permease subunit, partial [Deltaproteobacteria bacterium]|nr:ABC transporter permease subunit [Deltaproteobacteria bacterium]
KLREAEFVLAARTIGANHWRIMFRHLLPNSLTPLIVVATFAVPQMIIFEAALSFLGVGLPPDIVSWGSMLAWAQQASSMPSGRSASSPSSSKPSSSSPPGAAASPSGSSS